jgi:hypothetical protein
MLKETAFLFPPIHRLHESRNILLGERDVLAERLARAETSLAAAQREIAAGAARLQSLRAQRKALKADLAHAARALAAAEEAARCPFYHYHSRFDAQAVIRAHEVAAIEPRTGYVTNFLGVLTDPKVFPSLLNERVGEVEPVPIPANWHADIAEWAAALRAVDLARDRFTIIELGCGWGCWMANTGAAARRRGLAVRLIGVEGDAVHLAWARESLARNGFADAEIALHHGIAAGHTGAAWFPVLDEAGTNWGAQPVFEQTGTELETGRYAALKLFSLAELAEEPQRIDLLHIDIQGGEADLVSASLAVLRDKVAGLLIGTHSREIEGRLFEMLLTAGWVLEIERPAIMTLTESGPVVMVDGVQGWRNPRIRARSVPDA